MTLDPAELETLLFMVRERHAYMVKHTQAPQVERDKLARLVTKLVALKEDAEDEEVVDLTDNDGLRGCNGFEARADGSLVIWATLPDGDGEPIRVEPHRVCAVLAASGDALAKKASSR
jgi:hypothetical protein